MQLLNALQRFNEAAGIPRGRLPVVLPRISPALGASMRPRVFPAEDGAPVVGTPGCGKGFNEAAGIPRGRLASLARRGSDSESLQ